MSESMRQPLPISTICISPTLSAELPPFLEIVELMESSSRLASCSSCVQSSSPSSFSRLAADKMLLSNRDVAEPFICKTRCSHPARCCSMSVRHDLLPFRYHTAGIIQVFTPTNTFAIIRFTGAVFSQRFTCTSPLTEEQRSAPAPRKFCRDVSPSLKSAFFFCHVALPSFLFFTAVRTGALSPSHKSTQALRNPVIPSRFRRTQRNPSAPPDRIPWVIISSRLNARVMRSSGAFL